MVNTNLQIVVEPYMFKYARHVYRFTDFAFALKDGGGRNGNGIAIDFPCSLYCLYIFTIFLIFKLFTFTYILDQRLNI